MASTNARMIKIDPNFPQHKKCIFATPIGILLGNVVYKQGSKVDLAKIKVILDIKTLSILSKLGPLYGMHDIIGSL